MLISFFWLYNFNIVKEVHKFEWIYKREVWTFSNIHYLFFV